MEKDRFRFGELFDGFASQFSPNATLAHAAERHLRETVHPTIDPDRAGRQLAPGLERGLMTFRLNACRKPVVRFIGDRDGLVERIKGQD